MFNLEQEIKNVNDVYFGKNQDNLDSKCDEDYEEMHRRIDCLEEEKMLDDRERSNDMNNI